jgi:hypothetical protein
MCRAAAAAGLACSSINPFWVTAAGLLLWWCINIPVAAAAAVSFQRNTRSGLSREDVVVVAAAGVVQGEAPGIMQL